MGDRLVRTGRENTAKRIVKLETQGPAQPGEDMDYRVLKNQDIGAVLAVTVGEISFGTPPLSLSYRRDTPILAEPGT